MKLVWVSLIFVSLSVCLLRHCRFWGNSNSNQPFRTELLVRGHKETIIICIKFTYFPLQSVCILSCWFLSESFQHTGDPSLPPPSHSPTHAWFIWTQLCALCCDTLSLYINGRCSHTHTHTWLSVCLHAQALICSGRGAGLSWSPGGKVREKSLLELPEGKQRTKWGCDKKRGGKKTSLSSWCVSENTWND